MATQSLYRRYRSRNFAEIRGQEHVTNALRSAVAENRWSHAYLFSGPRGTGKTSTARVLAKALNCENLQNGEPCAECKSCLDIEQGKSFDLHELDAASNNKVDDVRDLIAKVALGSPGRTKVYILDEVHMLSAGAENALLKTLEEPPDHVVFVLATTEPHKVVETIRSRTQHHHFNLLPSADLRDHVKMVIADAGLDVNDDGIEYALRTGGGSARDTLSALQLVASTGGVPESSNVGREIATAIGAADPGATVAAVQTAIRTGREPRTIGEAVLTSLRHAFLSSMGASMDELSEDAQNEAAELSAALGPATITRSLEALGQALVEMRQAPDPRVPLEVTLLRLARRDGNDTAALIQRIESLEQTVAALQAGETPMAASAAAPQQTPSPTPAPAPQQQPAAAPQEQAPQAPAAQAPTPPTPAPQTPAPHAAAPAPAPQAQAPQAPTTPAPAPQAAAAPAPAPQAPAPHAPAPRRAPAPPRANEQPSPQPPAQQPAQQPPAQQPPAQTESAPQAPAATGGATITLAQLTAAFDSNLLDNVPQRVRSRFRVCHFTAVDANVATIAVPNAAYVDRVREVKADVEAAIAQQLGANLTIEVVVGEGAPPSNPPPGQPAPAPIQAGQPQSAPPQQAAPAPTPAQTAEAEAAEVGDISELADANDIAASSVDRIQAHFPGATVVPPPNS